MADREEGQPAMTLTREITVRVFKHDGTEYRRWNARLCRHEGDLVVLDAEFDVDVAHELLGEIKRGTRAVEYYWLNRWYNVFRFLKDDGNTRLWYCNTSTPPQFDGTTLSYIDLDIDILVQPDFSFQVLDEDEFETNAKIYGYSEKEKSGVHAAVQEVLEMIKRRHFPFLLESSSMSSLVNL